MRIRATVGAVAASILLASCGGGDQKSEAESSAVESIRPAASLNVTPKVLDDHRVEFSIQTTLPLPVTVATSLDLAGQAPKDTWIGYEGKRVLMDQPIKTVILDTSKAEPALPSGRYLATVSFHSRWGAEGNPDAVRVGNLEATVPVELKGSGASTASAELRNQRRSWVMSNLGANDPWDKRQFEQRLGPSTKSKSDLSSLHDAYYFPEADVTLIVNRVRNDVSVWRLGRETR